MGALAKELLCCEVFKLFATFAAALGIAGCNAGASSVPGAIGQSTVEAHSIPQWQAQNLAHRACPRARPGEVQCELLIMNKSEVKEPGWGARDIEAAYNLPSSSKGVGQIVAIVDAHDNPNVASDLAVYRRHYDLPKAKFLQVQSGRAAEPLSHRQCGLGDEIDVDVEMVSASCPNCTIYLIEANTLTAQFR